MKKDSVVEFRKPEEMRDAFSAFIRDGAQRLIAQAVLAEFDEFLAGFTRQTDAWGRSAVVRNGFLPERTILTGIGPIPMRVPKARSRTDAPAVFRSALVPTYVSLRTLDDGHVFLWHTDDSQTDPPRTRAYYLEGNRVAARGDFPTEAEVVAAVRAATP